MTTFKATKYPFYKWWLCSILALLGLIFVADTTARAGDMISEITVPNAQFELLPESGTLPPNWSYYTGGAPQTGLSLSTTEKFNGSRSLRFVKTLPSPLPTPPAAPPPLGAESAQLAVEPGDTYEASIKLKIQSYSGTPALWIRWYDASHQLLGKQAVYHLPINTTLNQWLDIKVKGMAPYNAKFATIFVYVPTTSEMTANVDEVQFFRIGDYNLLINPGFEDGTVTDIPKWSVSGVLQAYTSFERITSDKPVGGETASLRITDSTSTGSIDFLSDPIFVVTGTEFDVKANVKLKSGTQKLELKFYSNSAGTSEVIPPPPGTFFKSIANVPTDPNSPNATTWTPVSFQGKAPPSAIRARVVISSSPADTSEALYDNISLYPVGLDVPHTHSSPINLGNVAQSLSTQGGAISRTNNEIYFVTNGNPGTFYAVNATTGAINYSEVVYGTTNTWAVAVASNNQVYFSSTNDGKLWRYDPVNHKIEWIGTNPAPNSKFTWDLDADANGKLIGSTYSDPNDGRIFEFNTSTNTFSSSLVTDGFVMKPGQDYVRGAAVTNDYVYAGIGANRYLIKMNRTTQVKTQIPLPVSFQGTEGFVHNIWVYNGKLYVLTGTTIVVMAESSPHTEYTQIGYTDSKISPPSPYNADLLYYRNVTTSTLWVYNASTKDRSQVLTTGGAPIHLPLEEMRAVEWISIGGVNKLAMLFADTSYLLFDPATASLSTVSLNIPKNGINIQSLAREQGSSNIFIGGFIDSMSMFNESTPNSINAYSNPNSPHQIEEMGFLNGKTYLGVYGGAKIYRYNPSVAYHYGETPSDNPGLVYTVPTTEEQDRPYAFASGDNKLFIGTVPSYGKLGGSLTVYNESTATWTTKRNVVANQSITSLAYKNGILYGGSSIEGGLGINPTATAAKLFKWDIVGGNINSIPTSDLNIPNFTPTLIGHFTFDANNNLWGAAYGTKAAGGTTFVIFQLNPSDFSVMKSYFIYDNSSPGNAWRGFYLYFGSDGLLYTTVGRYLTVFDPNDLSRNTKVVNRNVQLMILGANGDIYYTTGGPELYTLPKSP
ncbi:hypothetical protein LOZ80_07260 [Paenibacillus sp. HWE-109]|uniref:hypothetical protein n=1 Tax=Paenibacillus sp. HWE-109 TaxID=1306526 RepID=UPI001EE02C70|nr:hypothetical protein [Paenibacillus sp. HWE-109]UKS28716.1 hypothetical protein LOZ80_07260 [Paenibacillus sp. HWE-109]